MTTQRNRSEALIDKRRLEELYDFVKHELRYREAVGDLIPREIKPSDIVDAVVIQAGREHLAQASAEKISERVRDLAARRIQSEAARLRRERNRAIHIEDDVPETPPQEEVKTLGEEIFYFYQPDEDLKIEDVLPDVRIPSPEQAVEVRELQQCFLSALDALPREWRQALRLRFVDGLSGASFAKAMHHSEPESERILQHATAYLRQRLLESGCAFEPPAAESLLPFEAEVAPERGSGH